MKKYAMTAALLAAALLVTGVSACADKTAGEEQTETENTNSEGTASESLSEITGSQVKEVHLVTDVYGDGQKPWYVVLEYDSNLAPDSVTADDYEAEGYEIEAAYTNTEPELPDESQEGNYVILALSTDYTTKNYGGSGAGEQVSSAGSSEDEVQAERPERKDALEKGGGVGKDGGMKTGDSEASNQLSVTLRQTEDIPFADGTTAPAWSDSITTQPEENVNLLV